MTSPRLLAIAGLFIALASPIFAQQRPTYPDAEAGQHVGEEATVTGKVAAVTKSSKGHSYLSLGDRFPRQVFSGVVFASDEEKVGDLKQYEGKQIALTGKIELSPDQKPQIVIRKAEQLALADGTAPAPTTAAMPAAAPATPAATPSPTPAAPAPAAVPKATPAMVASAATPAPKPPGTTPKIVLAPNWASPGQGSEMIRKDLARLFGGHSLPPEPESGVMVYPDVPYLTPLAVVKKLLNLGGATASGRVNCPGLPSGSLNAYAFTGVFAGGFTRLYVVTDNAEQVVSILAVDENARQRTSDITDNEGYHAYNFITMRVKGTNDLVVKHTIVPEGAPAGTVVVDSVLIDPTEQEKPAPGTRPTKTTTTKTYTPRTPKTGKVLERSRWYVPGPLVSLILRCASGR